MQNLKTIKKVFNLSQNSMNSFQIENIIKSIKKKQKINNNKRELFSNYIYPVIFAPLF